MVRFLKGLFGDAVEVAELQSVFATWQAGLQSKGFVEEKDFRRNWGAFCEGWTRVKLDNRAAFNALIAGYQPKPDATTREKVWALCEVLGAWHPNGVFYLSGKLAGLVTGVSQQRAGVILSELCELGLLNVVSVHNLYLRTSKTYRLARDQTESLRLATVSTKAGQTAPRQGATGNDRQLPTLT